VSEQILEIILHWIEVLVRAAKFCSVVFENLISYLKGNEAESLAEYPTIFLQNFVARF
jgi:hypothetical protein